MGRLSSPLYRALLPGGAADLGLQGAADGLAHRGGVDAEIALGLRLDEDVAQVGGLLHVRLTAR